jgi:hypothetical protein
VITATQRGVPQSRLDWTALAWLCVRVCYTGAYLGDWAGIRPVLWAVSVLIAIEFLSYRLEPAVPDATRCLLAVAKMLCCRLMLALLRQTSTSASFVSPNRRGARTATFADLEPNDLAGAQAAGVADCEQDASFQRCGTIIEMPGLPEDYRPRGAAGPYRARIGFDCVSTT